MSRHADEVMDGRRQRHWQLALRKGLTVDVLSPACVWSTADAMCWGAGLYPAVAPDEVLTDAATLPPSSRVRIA